MLPAGTKAGGLSVSVPVALRLPTVAVMVMFCAAVGDESATATPGFVESLVIGTTVASDDDQLTGPKAIFPPRSWMAKKLRNDDGEIARGEPSGYVSACTSTCETPAGVRVAGS